MKVNMEFNSDEYQARDLITFLDLQISQLETIAQDKEEFISSEAAMLQGIRYIGMQLDDLVRSIKGNFYCSHKAHLNASLFNQFYGRFSSNTPNHLILQNIMMELAQQLRLIIQDEKSLAYTKNLAILSHYIQLQLDKWSEHQHISHTRSRVVINPFFTLFHKSSSRPQNDSNKDTSYFIQCAI